MQKLPLFPLSAHLLPGGRMSLRIFEPRYVRMVKTVCAEDSTFIMCMLNARGHASDNTHIHAIGTQSRIIDFDMLEDGLLGITVAGINMVKISEIETQTDGLCVGRCDQLNDWSTNDVNEPLHPINVRLTEIFENYPEINALYGETFFDDPAWVVCRWLELLPVEAAEKQQYLAHQDCKKALSFLKQLIE